MDDLDYFDKHDDNSRERLMRFFLENHPAGSAYYDYIKTLEEAYLVFGNRTSDNYFEVQKYLKVK